MGDVSAVVFEGQDMLSSGSVSGTDDADVLTGGVGADTFLALGAVNSVNGGSGDDSLVGGDGNNTLRGGHGDDTLIAGIGTDTIYGDDGNDILVDSQANDEIHGGAGNDLAFIGVYEDSDSIYMDEGIDFIDGQSAGSAFHAEGGDGNNLINASNGNDTIHGNEGNDGLSSGAGYDTLDGGAGTDTLTGGTGDEVFAIHAVEGSVTVQGFGVDDAADRIDVSGLGDVFETPEELMVALSCTDRQTNLSFDVDGCTSLLTIMSENELDEDDFFFYKLLRAK
ncbi:calcium-binding protein [uncultured Sulfitobacter sp.]|uniref:calcium-binding protein n=1 Tax=uncultured Sulfitobacter sp. TaxID=191468 RepID=UPI00262E7C49|nr:calcium-binding protein [uncultured Sulfitobacter sp.]